jgi:hypothetical protein
MTCYRRVSLRIYWYFRIRAQVIQNRKRNEKKIWIEAASSTFFVPGGNTNLSRIMIDSSLRRLGIS